MEAIIEKIHKEFKVSADSTLKKSKKFLKSYKPIEIKESSDVDFSIETLACTASAGSI